VVEGEAAPATLAQLGRGRYRLLADGEATDLVMDVASVTRGATITDVLVDGFRFEVEVQSERLASLREQATRTRGEAASHGALQLRAVIPGRVVAMWVAEGDAVTTGDRLLGIEAMKMQNELLSPRDGTIARIAASLGATVEIGDVLVVIE